MYMLMNMIWLIVCVQSGFFLCFKISKYDLYILIVVDRYCNWFCLIIVFIWFFIITLLFSFPIFSPQPPPFCTIVIVVSIHALLPLPHMAAILFLWRHHHHVTLPCVMWPLQGSEKYVVSNQQGPSGVQVVGGAQGAVNQGYAANGAQAG